MESKFNSDDELPQNITIEIPSKIALRLRDVHEQWKFWKFLIF